MSPLPVLISQVFVFQGYRIFVSHSGKMFLLLLLIIRETIKFLVMSQVTATSLIKNHLSKQNFTGGDIAQENALVHLGSSLQGKQRLVALSPGLL